MKPKKWLIIFPDSWPSYSPSLINFIKMLKKYDIESVVCYPEDSLFVNSGLTVEHFTFKYNRTLLKAAKYFKLLSLYKILMLLLMSRTAYIKYGCNFAVGIDDLGFIAAYFIKKDAIYFSLDISKSRLNKFIFSAILPRILIIQSKERKEYLCKEYKEINTAYIQNSNIHREDKIALKDYGGKLIYFGSLIPIFGTEICIRSLYSLENETLTLKGVNTFNKKYCRYLELQYGDLFDSGRLRFDFTYIENDDIAGYLQDFDIGFCFYDFELVNDFNYASSPSGKMFNYFSAGMPIIGSHTAGLLPVMDFDAGILLQYPNNRDIKSAVNKIRQNFTYYRQNSFRASVEFDFSKMFEENREKILSAHFTLTNGEPISPVRTKYYKLTSNKRRKFSRVTGTYSPPPPPPLFWFVKKIVLNAFRTIRHIYRKLQSFCRRRLCVF